MLPSFCLMQNDINAEFDLERGICTFMDAQILMRIEPKTS